MLCIKHYARRFIQKRENMKKRTKKKTIQNMNLLILKHNKTEKKSSTKRNNII